MSQTSNDTYSRLTDRHYQTSPNIRNTCWTDWPEFWLKVLRAEKDELCAIIHDESDFPASGIRAQLEGYFAGAQQKTEQADSKTVEIDLQHMCLDPLVTFADRVLEDVSDAVRDYTRVTETTSGRIVYEPDPAADAFRRIIFRRKNEASSRVYFALRHRCGQETSSADDNLQTVATYPSSLDVVPPLAGPVGPVWRMAPWEIIAFLELKRLGTNLALHVMQLAFYCDSLIHTTPGRRVAFGVLTNLHECRFVAVRLVADGTTEWFTSATITGQENVARALAHFLTSPVSALQATARFPTEVLQPERPLGRGSTGIAMSVSVTAAPGTNLVAKISPNASSLEAERLVLQHLHACQPGLPIIPEVAEQQGLIGDYGPPGAKLSHCTLFKREFHDVKPSDISADSLIALWDMLDVVHSFGVVHCDLRTPNVMVDPGTGRLVLIDWGASRPFKLHAYRRNLPPRVKPLRLRDHFYQRGAMITASPAVLDWMEVDARIFECLPADEAVSMIYLTLQFQFPQATQIHTAPATVKVARNTWKDFLDGIAFQFFNDDQKNAIATAIQNLQDGRTTLSSEDIAAIVCTTIQLIFVKGITSRTQDDQPSSADLADDARID